MIYFFVFSDWNNNFILSIFPVFMRITLVERFGLEGVFNIVPDKSAPKVFSKIAPLMIAPVSMVP